MISSPSTRSPKIGPGRNVKSALRGEKADPGDVGRHEIGGELNAPEVETQCQTECPDEQCLGGAGNAFEQHVAPRDQRGNRFAHGARLAEHHGLERLNDAGRGSRVGNGFVGGDRSRIGGHDGLSSSQSVSTSSAASRTSSAVARRFAIPDRRVSASCPRAVCTPGAIDSSQVVDRPPLSTFPACPSLR